MSVGAARQHFAAGTAEWRALTFAVVAERHLGLAETNRVLALGDAIELFELGLVDALQRDWLDTGPGRGGDAWQAKGKAVAGGWRGCYVPGWGSRAQWP